MYETDRHGAAVDQDRPNPMIDTVKRFIAGPPATTLFECRHCGTAVDEPVEACENCGSSEIATYRIPR